MAWEAPLNIETQRALFDEFDADGTGGIDEGEILTLTLTLT